MKIKTVVKIVTDVAMTVLLFFLMGYQFWGNQAHEWFGAALFVLFIAHHILNAGWYKNIFRGKYTPVRITRLMIDIMVLITMLLLMYSGIIMSRHVFRFLPVQGSMALARRIHMLASYWGFVFMSFHLGLHWEIFLSLAKRAAGCTKTSHFGVIICWILGTAVAAYGLYAFVQRKIASNLFLQNEFVFLDFGESKILFYLDYLAMMGLFIWAAHFLGGLLKKWSSRKRKGDSI